MSREILEKSLEGKQGLWVSLGKILEKSFEYFVATSQWQD
jgi:hypothetical protein